MQCPIFFIRAALLSGAALLLLAACGDDGGPPGPPGLTFAQVVRVVDGDTIDVLIDGQRFRVRYIGIDTPESVDPRRPVECFGQEASERNRQLVEGKSVGLEKDVSEVDDFGRLLRYVWAEGRMVNAVLVEEGFATVVTFPPDVKHLDWFLTAEEQARHEGAGLWSACATPTPSPTGAKPPRSLTDSSFLAVAAF